MKKEKEKTNFAPFLLIYDHIAAKYEILTWSCDFQNNMVIIVKSEITDTNDLDSTINGFYHLKQ